MTYARNPIPGGADALRHLGVTPDMPDSASSPQLPRVPRDDRGWPARQDAETGATNDEAPAEQ